MASGTPAAPAAPDAPPEVPPAASAAPDVPSLPITLPDVARYEGALVVAVRAVVLGSVWTTPPKTSAPHVGDRFRLVEARDELSAILARGGFANGELDVATAPAGVEVIYRVVPSRFVRRVTFHGNVLPEEDVRRAGDLLEARDVTERSLEAASLGMRAYYARRGYPAATVRVATIETDNPLAVVVDVRIDPGRRAEIVGRELAVAPKTPETIAAAQSYAVRVGDRADAEAFDAADRALTESLRRDGYPNATVKHAVRPDTSASAADQGRSLIGVITVLAGSKIVVSFEGNVAFDRIRLLAILDLAAESDRSESHLASKIETAYLRRGYFDARVVPELLGAVGDPERTLLFRIREGSILVVKRREYPCLRGSLGPERLDREIESYLDEELDSGAFGAVAPDVADFGISTNRDIGEGARPRPEVPEADEIFAPDVYETAVEHLRELFRSEGYIFVEIGEAVLVRGRCAPGSQPGPRGCRVVEPPPLPDICRTDLNGLPRESVPIPRTFTCTPDFATGRECAPAATVVIPINPGPRSLLWDIAFEGAHAVAPERLGRGDVAGQELRLGEPLSLKDVESARRRVLDYYRDEGYAFVSARATIDYSSDRSRARVRFLISEGERVYIDRILVEGENRTLESLIRARLLIKEGGLYKAKLARESQERLAQLGVFSSVSLGLASPNIPANRKTVVITVVERLPQHFEVRPGFSTGEGFRYYAEYGYANLFGYAVSLDFRGKISYQPFFGADQTGQSIYDPEVLRRWRGLTGLDRFPRRVSAGITLPHSPIFGTPVRTTLEFVHLLDLRRDYKLARYSPVLTLTYSPTRWFAGIFAGDFEWNNFSLFDPQQGLDAFLTLNPQFATTLRIPTGSTGVAATRATFNLDFRDNRLNATKNGFVSITNEYVRTILAQENIRQDFLHVTGAAGVYFRIAALPKAPILAIELLAGSNFNVFSCVGQPLTVCNTYPDRLFYVGGIDTFRGFTVGDMLPQDTIDDLSTSIATLGSSEGGPCNIDDPALSPKNCVDLRTRAPRGGNIFVNPRVELRVPAFKWGGFVIFVDAANSWRNKTRFQPWKLRYAVGPGLSIDTPVGPIALDVGYNLTRNVAFGEPVASFHFSIGRF